MSRSTARIHLDDDLQQVIDYYYDLGMTDGLPIVPPTPERVEAMMHFCDRSPLDVVGSIPPGHGLATIETLAVNAVMAGCQPEFFPVIVTAVEAMLETNFNLLGIQGTTHPVAPLVVVNGPIAKELCINSGSGCFGPGWKANATIGRAIRLILMNIGGGYPGKTDKSTLGGPAKYSYVIAENEAESPWNPWHVDHGYDRETSTVTVMGCEAPHNINDHAALNAVELMTTICSTFAVSGCNNIYLHGDPVLILGPEHAATIAADGWDKNRVKRYLWENARIPLEEMNAPNIERFAVSRPKFFANAKPGDRIPLIDDANDFVIMVAGGAGKHSNFIPTLGETKFQIRPITTKGGRPVRSITELV